MSRAFSVNLNLVPALRFEFFVLCPKKVTTNGLLPSLSPESISGTVSSARYECCVRYVLSRSGLLVNEGFSVATVSSFAVVVFRPHSLSMF